MEKVNSEFQYILDAIEENKFIYMIHGVLFVFCFSFFYFSLLNWLVNCSSFTYRP